MDEGVARRSTVDLLAELAHEDVDGAVSMALASTPDPLHQLVPRHDAPPLEGELVQEPELRRRQLGACAVDVGLRVPPIDHELLELEELAAVGGLGADAAAGRRANPC